MRPVPRKDRKCGSEETERFASVIVVGQVSERVRIRTPRGLEVGGITVTFIKSRDADESGEETEMGTEGGNGGPMSGEWLRDR